MICMVDRDVALSIRSRPSFHRLGALSEVFSKVFSGEYSMRRGGRSFVPEPYGESRRGDCDSWSRGESS